MREILTLAHKDLRLLLRDKTGFFFTLMWPLIIAIFFGTIFGGGGGGGHSAMAILLVDEDETERSQEFVSTLDSAPELDITTASHEEAVDLVRRRKAIAYVTLKRGFGEASGRMFWGEPPTVELGTDPARQAEAAMIEGILMKYGAERIQQFFSDPAIQRTSIEEGRASIRSSPNMPAGIRDNLEQLYTDLDRFLGHQSLEPGADTELSAQGRVSGFQPLVVERTDVTVISRQWPTSSYAISFPQGVIWGILGASAGFAISIVIERSRGTLLRLQVAPISRMHILAGKAAACFISTTGIAVGLYVFGFFVFRLRPTSYPLLVMAVLSTAIAFVGIMMLLSVVGKTEQAAGGIGWAVLIVMSMLGGGMIPLFAMPAWMHRISDFSPVKWSILAMEGAVWRGFSFGEMLQPCGILIILGVVCFLIGVRTFSWTSQAE
ncbi:MAG: ABC transporter permease [Candidatus Eisenbacteria bacterium]